jgi:hypothetical protein
MPRDPDAPELRDRGSRDLGSADAGGLSVVRDQTRRAGAVAPLATAIVVLLVGLAVAKPWGEGSVDRPSIAPRADAVAPSGPPEPTADSAAALAGPVCLGAEAWRITSHETWRTREVRVWRAVEPIAEADGPLDPAIPSVPIVAVDLDALGWCAAAYGPDRPLGPATVSAWLVAGGSARELALVRVQPEAETPIAALYVPADTCEAQAACPSCRPRSQRGAWPGGRVVFRYEDAGTGTVAWFAAEIVLLDELAEPGPTAS